MVSPKPVFPLRVFYADGSVEELKDEDYAAWFGDPWFDSEDDEDNRRRGVVQVVDQLGRPVHLLVEKCDIVICEIKESLEGSARN